MLLLHSSHQPSIKTSATRPPPEAPSPPYPLLMTSQCCKKKRKEKTKTRRLQVYRSRKSQKHYSILAWHMILSIILAKGKYIRLTSTLHQVTRLKDLVNCGWKILMEKEGVLDLGLTVVYCKCKTECTDS